MWVFFMSILTKLATSISLSLLVASCSTQSTQSSSGIYRYDQAVTHSRISLKSGKSYYWADLAMVMPSNERCDSYKGESNERCKFLNETMSGKDVLLSRRYDRYDLPMYSVWVLDSNGEPDGLSVSLQMIVNGTLPDEELDRYFLPKDLSEGLEKAQAYRKSKTKVLESRGGLKPWMIEKLEQKGMHDE